MLTIRCMAEEDEECEKSNLMICFVNVQALRRHTWVGIIYILCSVRTFHTTVSPFQGPGIYLCELYILVTENVQTTISCKSKRCRVRIDKKKSFLEFPNDSNRLCGWGEVTCEMRMSRTFGRTYVFLPGN